MAQLQNSGNRKQKKSIFEIDLEPVADRTYGSVNADAGYRTSPGH
jgi:hypothetical protein